MVDRGPDASAFPELRMNPLTDQTSPTDSSVAQPGVPSPGHAHPPKQGGGPKGPAGPGGNKPEREKPADLDDGLAAEINAAMDASVEHQTKAKKERKPAPHRDPVVPAGGFQPAIRGPRVVQSGREHRTGVVVSVGPTDIFIEFGPKELGVLPRLQFKEGDELPKPKDSIEVVVDKFEKDEALYICSRPGQVQKADWEMLEPGQIVEARVTGVNKGGLELEVAHHRAFMPASQVDIRRIEDLSVFVGEKLKCKVTRVDRTGKGNITLSRREIVGEERKEILKGLKDSLKEGDVRDGIVKKIMPFGAFVDIGGVDGLVHITDITHDRIRKVEDHLKEGQAVKVKVLKLDWENERHSLGLKQLTADPYESALADIVEGAEVNGRVTKLMEFGAFVEVAPGVEGLVHISELSWKRVGKTSDVLQPDQVIKVKVLKLDKETKKIGLSLKQTQPQPEAPAGGERGGGGGGGGRGGSGGGGFGGGGGRGRGRGDKFEKDTRTPEEILKETPQLRRMREEAKKKHGKDLKSGLGKGHLGIGLGDLKL